MSRLQKLLSMLGSEQPGEADAARRKLLDHLGSHRLSLTDVAVRLRAPPPPAAEGPSLWLQRELHVARVARQEAEFDVKRAQQRLSDLSRSLQEAGVDVTRAAQAAARARLAAALGWTLALLAGAGLLVPLLHDRPLAADQSATLLRRADPQADPAGQRYGTVLVQDLAVRLTPNAEGEVRAFLNRGTRVVVDREVQLGTEQWLRIRSVSGDGWVRDSDILR